MIRKNRLKKILFEQGFIVDAKTQPLNKVMLKGLNISRFRIREILENRVDKEDLSITEIDSICEWLGITPGDLLIPKGKEKVDEFIQVKMHTTVHVYSPGSSRKNNPELFVNA